MWTNVKMVQWRDWKAPGELGSPCSCCSRTTADSPGSGSRWPEPRHLAPRRKWLQSATSAPSATRWWTQSSPLVLSEREREGEMKTHPDLTLTILIQKLRHQTVAKQNLKIRTTCGCSAEGCNDQLSLTLFDRTPVLLTYMTPPPVARISPKLRVPGPSCPLLCRHVSRRGQSLQSGPAGGGGGGGAYGSVTQNLLRG